MNEADIRKYAGLMKELDLTGLEITEDNRVVRLERSGSAQPAVQTPQWELVPVSESTGVPDGAISVCSPMVGVFYAASAENAEPFVRVGDHVECGSTLCIVEAMKLMNEITAEQSGTIVEICAENGQVVDYGRELFRIRGDAS